MMLILFAITLRKIENFSLNAKDLIINLRLVRNSFLFILIFFSISTLWAQVEPRVKTPNGVLPTRIDNADSTLNPSDSLLVKKDSVKTATKKSDITTTINYSANDSLFINMDNKMSWLYGDAKIKYGIIELEAEEVNIDYLNNTVAAHGIVDSLGETSGYPIFKNGQELYETKDIIYNFKNKRARISEVVTEQSGGYLRGKTVFKNEKGELLSLKNSYTTCNQEHPHYRIRATKTKAIPNDKIVAGPFYFEFNEIPLPVGFLFGMFPAQRESKSGIIFPSYGEDRRRGFNLRNLGYFFDINDYIKLSITSDVYSKGGYSLYVRSNYVNRYHYTGSVNFSYARTKTNDKIEAPAIANDFYLTWSHSPQSKGTGRFSASVTASTSTYSKNNNLNSGISNQFSTTSLNPIAAKLSSNISYSKKFSNTPFSASINFSHSQDLATKRVDMPFPILAFNMANQYPFQRDNGKTGFFDNLSVGYAMTATNQLTNNLGRINLKKPLVDSIAPFNFQNLGLFFSNAKKGIHHTPSISFSFKALKYLTISPQFTYDEKWYFERLNWQNPDRDIVDPLTTPLVEKGFQRVYNFSYGLGTTTRLYGTYFFKRGNIKAIRHIVNPGVSFNYSPDFSNNPNFFQAFATPTATQPNLKTYKSRFESFAYGGSTSGKSGSVGFSLGNNLEMKIKSAKDTVEKKVSLLNNFSISSSYNLIADSFKLAPFAMAANTNVLNNLLNVNVSASLDPYYYGHNPKTVNPENPLVFRPEKRYDTYSWQAGKIGRITNASLALSTNLNPKARKKENETRQKVGESKMPEHEKQNILNNPNAYIDFDIPWSLNVSYNLSYSRGLLLTSTTKAKQINQTLQFSGDLSISEKWKINFNSGYDFERKDFTQTNISMARDLHCWTMNLTWVPFGLYQSYNFTIAVKAPILQDLKIERRKPFLDNL